MGMKGASSKGKGKTGKGFAAKTFSYVSGKASGKAAGMFSSGKAAGKGKSAGKGGKTSNPGYAGKRERVGNERVTGKLVQWRGPFGWIVPDVAIDHPMAEKHGGKIYLDQIDVEQEISGVGARVSFFVYTDGAGLGAQRCTPAKGAPPVAKTIVKSKEATKGKGKSKGKGKGKAAVGEDGEVKELPPPDKEKRETLSPDMVTGVVMDWRGQVGWIKPDEPVDYAEVSTKGKRRGMFWCHASDVEGEMPLMGAQVGFFVYKDENGCGAELIQVILQGDGNPPGKPKEAAAEEDAEMADGDAEKPKVAKKSISSLAFSSAKKAKGEGKGEAKGKGKGKGVEKTIGKSKGAKGKGKGKGAGKDDEEKGPRGPDLPRERITDEPILGEVVTFKGRIGWIKPSEEISHPEAAKRGGKIYVHKKDLVGAETLEQGSSVQFFVFKDASGLGAEEVVVC